MRSQTVSLPTGLFLPLFLSIVLSLSCALQRPLAAPGTGVLILPAGTLALTSPDPGLTTVVPCDDLNGVILAPDQPEAIPATEVGVEIRDNTNRPIEGLVVVATFTSAHTLCPDGVFTAVTNADGWAYMTLVGGGCSDGIALSGVFKANGVTVRAYDNVKSPDFDGAGGDLTVNIADLVVFSGEFLGTSGTVCHDYDNNGVTNLGDLVIFSPAFVSANHCP